MSQLSDQPCLPSHKAQLWNPRLRVVAQNVYLQRFSDFTLTSKPVSQNFFFYDLQYGDNFLVKPPQKIKHVLQMSSSSQRNTNSLVIIHTLTHCVLQTQNVHRTKNLFSTESKKKHKDFREAALSYSTSWRNCHSESGKCLSSIT